MRAILVSSLLLYGMACLLGCGRKPAGPPDFQRMPHKLGMWKGADQPLSAKACSAIGADVVVERHYKHPDEPLADVETHLAVFSDLNTIGRTDPMTVCKAAGWKLVEQSYDSICTGTSEEIRVSVTQWKLDQGGVTVLHWYQLGDNTLLNQSELDKLRAELKGQAALPRLVKVQLQLPTSSLDATRTTASLKRLATKVRQWLDSPYYDR
jgi:hypothetical protein